MSYAATFNALQVSNVTPGQKLVLAAIASFERAGKAWPSIATLAKRCSMGARTVQRHIASLISLGYIERIYRTGRSAITRVFIGETHAKLAPPPTPNWHPESGIPESVNQIPAAPPAEPLPAAVSPPLFFSEIQEQPEQPDTAILALEVAPGADTFTPLLDAPVPTANELAATEPVSALVIDENPLAEVSKELLEEWAEIRKFKKKTPKPVKTEAQILAQEAAKAGLSVQDVILLMVLRGWSRFQADWIPHVPPQAVVQGPQAVYKPEPLPVATPSVVAAAKARLAELRAEIVSGSARKRVEKVAVRR